jgi:hypothetical protein
MVSVGPTGTARISFFGWRIRLARQGGAGCRTCRNAVVDDDRDTVFDAEASSATEIEPSPPFDFGEFSLAHGLEVAFVHPREPDDILIADNDVRIAINDGAHRQFRLPGHADFAHEHKIDGRAKRRRDLGGNGNPAARQSQQHGMLAFVLCEPRGQLPSGI